MAAVVLVVVVVTTLAGWPANGMAAPTVVPAGWEACPSGAAAVSLVREYPRVAAGSLDAGASGLQCGNEKFGLRHILMRHQIDWQEAAGSADWVGFTDAANAGVLSGPTSAACDGRRNTCAFRGPVPVEAVVVVARQDGKVVTAYPTD